MSGMSYSLHPVLVRGPPRVEWLQAACDWLCSLKPSRHALSSLQTHIRAPKRQKRERLGVLKEQGRFPAFLLCVSHISVKTHLTMLPAMQRALVPCLGGLLPRTAAMALRGFSAAAQPMPEEAADPGTDKNPRIRTTRIPHPAHLSELGGIRVPTLVLVLAEGDYPIAKKGIRLRGTPLYLDMQATTPMDPRVVDAMLPFMTDQVHARLSTVLSNPSSAT